MYIADALLHEGIVGAEENDGICGDFLDGPDLLVVDAGRERVCVPMAHGRGAQVDGGDKLRVGPITTGA